VDTSNKPPTGDRQRALTRYCSGEKVPHDGLSDVTTCLDAAGHKVVTGVQMACMCLVLAAGTQSGSSALRPGGDGGVGRAASMEYGDIQQGGTAGRGKGNFNVGPRPLTANSCNANGIITGLRTRTTACTGGDVAESFLSVVMSARAASAQVIATHGVVDIVVLDTTPTKESGGRDMWVGASSAKEVATDDEVAVGDAKILVDRDNVQITPCVPALGTKQACTMQWGVTSVDKFCGRALIECVQKGGALDPDLPSDHHQDNVHCRL
jgi:hypothetical protein